MQFDPIFNTLLYNHNVFCKWKIKELETQVNLNQATDRTLRFALDAYAKNI